MIQTFLESSFIWRDAIIASVLAAILCGWLGTYVVLKRIIFVGAALPQASGFGIALAFFIGSFLGPHGHEASFLLNPLFVSVTMSALVAAVFSLNLDHRKLSNETVIGLGYIICSALVIQILNSPRIVQEAHEIGDILFGNAVVIDPQVLKVMIITFCGVLLIHTGLFKEFASLVFDSEFAATLKLPVRRLNLILYLTIAVAVSISTRAIGAMPVFGFLVIPPACALLYTTGLKSTIALTCLIGALSAAGGYFCSFIFSWPTGATMVGVASVFLIPGLIRLRTQRG